MRHLAPRLCVVLIALTACHHSSSRTRRDLPDGEQPRLPDADVSAVPDGEVDEIDPDLDAADLTDADAGSRVEDASEPRTDASDGAPSRDANAPWLACQDKLGTSFCVGGERVRCDAQGVLHADPCSNGLPCQEVKGMVFCATEVDECALHLDDCVAQATCVNTKEGYGCRCPQGYEGAGVKTVGCFDIDECNAPPYYSNPCERQTTGRGRCVNTPGSYHCECEAGNTGTGSGRCEDIDECARDGNDATCGLGAECFNTYGSYGCQCLASYLRNPRYFANPRGCHKRGWRDARLISNAQGNAAHPVVAIDAPSVVGGDEVYPKVVVWEQSDGARTNVWINGDDWYDGEEDLQVATAEQLNVGDSNASSPVVSSGSMTAAWIQRGTARDEVWVKAGSARKHSTDAEGSADARHPSLTSGAWRGDAIAWQVGDGPSASIWADRYLSAQAVRLGAGTRPAIGRPDQQGHTRVVWLTHAPRTLVSRKFQAGGEGWLGEELVSDDVADEDANISLDGGGDGMITWRSNAPASLPMARYVALRSPFSFGAVVALDDRPARQAPSVAMANAQGLAVWVADGGVLRAGKFALPQGWTSGDLDAHGDGSIANATVKIDATGNGFAVWSRYAAGTSTIWGAHYVDGRWQERFSIATSSLANPMVSMDMNSEGRAGVAWVDRDEHGISRIWFRPFE